MSGHRLVFSGKKKPSQPISGFDYLFNSFTHWALIYNHVLSEKILIESLEKYLHFNPYFSGRLVNMDTPDPRITACDSGVLFTVEYFDEVILDFFSCDSSYIDRSCLKPISIHTTEHTPLLQIKLSNYKNGSILGISCQHMVCDGQSLFDFLDGWGKLARGEEPNEVGLNRDLFKKLTEGNDGSFPAKYIPIVRGDFDSIIKTVKKPLVSKKTFRLTSHFIDKLYKKAKSNGVRGRVGVKDSVWIAYIWRLIVSNQVSESNKVTFSQVYDSRFLMGLSKNYFGNAPVYPFFQIEKDKLNDLSLESITEKILSLRADLVNNSDSLCKNIAFWDERMREGSLQKYMYEIFKLCLEGEFLINNLIKQPIYDVDFGSGCPIWFESPYRDQAFRNIHAFPAPEKNGDVILFVTLPYSEMIELSRYIPVVSGVQQ